MIGRRMGLSLFALSLVATPALAQEFAVGDLVIEHPWARATAKSQKNGAVYMVLENKGQQPDQLTSATSDVADHAQMHAATTDANGIAKMGPVQSVEVPAGGETKIAPGGLHLMLIGLHHPLSKGETFTMKLTFAKAGTVEVEVLVEGVGGPQEPGHMQMHENQGTRHSS
jgi:periplasmic copper chaperone A